MSHLINIFLEPAKVFAELREKPTFWTPMLLLAVLTAVSTLLYFMTVDPAWFAEHQAAQMLLQNPEMTSAELAQIQAMMPGARVMGWFAAAGALLMFAVVFLVYAVYYLLAGKITGNPVSFRHGLALVAWASMPMVLGSLVVIGAVLTSSPFLMRVSFLAHSELAISCSVFCVVGCAVVSSACTDCSMSA